LYPIYNVILPLFKPLISHISFSAGYMSNLNNFIRSNDYCKYFDALLGTFLKCEEIFTRHGSRR